MRCGVVLLCLMKTIVVKFTYTTLPKICGHLLVEHLIPKSWALIWSWFHSLHAITAYTLLRRRSTRCWNIAEGDLLPFSHKSISEVRHWCWTIMPGSQSVFQFIPKVFDGVEVRALCRPVKFFHSDLDKPFLYVPRVVHWGIVMLKQERAFPNCCHRVGSTESSRMSLYDVWCI